MENYRKARTEEEPCPCPFTGLPAGTPEMRVKDGSKIRNLLGFAAGRLEGGEARSVVFVGTGRSVAKAVSCVEVLKRRVHGLHQLTRLQYRRTQEVWEPLEPAAGLDSLTVSRNVPAVWILLSKDPLDDTQPGYQPPGCFDTLWAQAAKEEGAPPPPRRRRGGASRGRGARQGGRRDGVGKVQSRGGAAQE
ncbi:ribonuclease P protein subunit p25-like protein [Amia ocellicauda]|uniref:ribonuclease P protein subunit p25-like protein n=1 Tax=Amia ocellicauda TaxID=2972642 RepID=UPI003464336F